MIDDTSTAILLLNARFSSAGNEQVSPLTPSEWGRFAEWLKSQEKRPADLLTKDLDALLAGWEDKRLTVERIRQLLERGNAMALALEKWSRSGVWVITRSDAEYPRFLKQRLGVAAPAVLYGCGNKLLLNRPAIGVVGSRKANQNDLDYADALGRNISQQAYSVVSGCARGIDEVSMQGALNNEGTAIGVVADSLLQAARAKKWRDGLMSNNLLLVSPYYPDAAFSAGNAMGRNKFIYCLSQAALVVHSGKDGGTWNGAEENLKKGWVPLWVKRTTDKQGGNDALVRKGGQWLPDDPMEVDISTLIPVGANIEAAAALFDNKVSSAEADLLAPIAPQADLKTQEAPIEPAVVKPDRAIGTEDFDPVDIAAVAAFTFAEQDGESEDNGCALVLENSETPEVPESSMQFDAEAAGFYDFFLMKLATHTGSFTADSLSDKWQLPKSVVKSWLADAEEAGKVFKLTKPIRFVFNTSDQTKVVSGKTSGSRT